MGFTVPRMIRRIIKDHLAALQAFGEVCSRTEQTGSKGGRPGTAFYLNEEQALYVTMHCRTERAEVVKIEVVKVFTAWRRGQLQAPNLSDPLVLARLLQTQLTAHIASEEGRPSRPSRNP